MGITNFSEEDQKWILESSKDLEAEQIARILKVSIESVEIFIDSAIPIKRYKQDSKIKRLITREWVENSIKEGLYQKDIAYNLGLTKMQFRWILKGKGLSYEKIRQELGFLRRGYLTRLQKEIYKDYDEVKK